MLDAKRFLKRIVLVGLISVLPGFVNVVSAHGGHGSGGSAGSGGGSSSGSSSGGHSTTGMSGGHSSGISTSHSAASSKGGRFAGDPSNQTMSGVNFHSRDHHSFDVDHFDRARFNRQISTGQTGQNIQNGMVPNEDWKRRHQHLLFGFLPY